jgi:hypothetical protein
LIEDRKDFGEVWRARLGGNTMVKPAVNRLVAPPAQTAPLVRLVGGAADSAAFEVSRPAAEAVAVAVLRERHDFQVLEAVILLVAVLVVYAFVRLEFAAEMLSHGVPVFGDSGSVGQSELNVAMAVDPPTTVEPLGSFARAEGGGAGNPAVDRGAVLELTRLDFEHLAAVPAVSRQGLPLHLRAAGNGAGFPPLCLTRDGLERDAANLANNGFHAGIVPIATGIWMSVAAKKYSLITEAT